MEIQHIQHIQKIQVSFQDLSKILRGEIRPLQKSLSPDDIEVVGVEQPIEGVLHQWCYVYITSQSFPPIYRGFPIPISSTVS